MSVFDNTLDRPTYLIADAARYLRMPATTVRHWSLGHAYKTPSGRTRFADQLIEIADRKRGLLSFPNLVELHVPRSIRKVHQVKARQVRKAINYLKQTTEDRHPLIRQEILTDGISLFIVALEQFVDLTDHGQMVMKEALQDHVKRITWNKQGLPLKLFPFTRDQTENAPTLISINPQIRFGRPCLASSGLPTHIVWERHQAGDGVIALAKDYGCEDVEIEEAIRYESRVAA